MGQAEKWSFYIYTSGGVVFAEIVFDGDGVAKEVCAYEMRFDKYNTVPWEARCYTSKASVDTLADKCMDSVLDIIEYAVKHSQRASVYRFTNTATRCNL